MIIVTTVGCIHLTSQILIWILTATVTISIDTLFTAGMGLTLIPLLNTALTSVHSTIPLLTVSKKNIAPLHSSTLNTVLAVRVEYFANEPTYN